MAVLKKIRSRLFSAAPDAAARVPGEPRAAAEARGGAATAQSSPTAAQSSTAITQSPSAAGRYDIRPLTITHIEECWRLDQRCFVDGEAYSRDTFEYLLTSPDSIAYRAVTPDGALVGFIVGLIEPDRTGHITTLGVAPEHRRRGIAGRMLARVEEGFRRRRVSTVRLEVRSVNAGAQELYRKLGYAVTQRLPRYYSNGGDGLLMVKALDQAGGR
ncbi:MAG: GNAT family N-acetyltransferase [Acidobacteria bacterium]|nr:GNAT family N-acetyltransferase [Acidobacteriota bacterium]